MRTLLRRFRVPLDLLVVSEDNYQYWRDTPGNVYYEAATKGVTLYERLLMCSIDDPGQIA